MISLWDSVKFHYSMGEVLMDSGLFFAILLLYQAQTLSSQEQTLREAVNASCPKNFPCGKNLSLSFPFAEYSPYDCGLCPVNCSNESFPTIALGYPAEQWFRFEALNSSTSTMTLYDDYLQSLLDTQNCSAFWYPIYLPTSPPILFTMLNNVTLFRCNNKDPQTIQKLNSSFFENDYDGYYGGCGDDVYYYQKHPNSSTPPPANIDPSCLAFSRPMNKFFPQYLTKKSDDDVSEVFRLLSGEFDLQWYVPRCYSCRRGGRCPTGCVYSEHSGKTKLGLILGLVGAACVLLIFAILLLLWRRKKWVNGLSYILSRNSSKLELEDDSVYLGLSVFSYSELEEATKNFDSSKELGDGGFGTVYHGKLRDGREVAVKRLYEHNYKRMEQFMNEVEILTRLRHPNLVTLYGCTSRRSRELLLVYEYVPNGTVADHLNGHRANDKHLTWALRMNIAIETAEALAYLHASDIIHRDVKTNNILLDHNFSVKVADFGLSRLFPNDVTHVSTAPQGTPGYVDPEYHQCYQLTDKSDVYSFGVVLIELISSMPAVDISRHRHEINLANFAINRIQRCAFDDLIDPSLGYKTDAEILRMTTSVAELAFRCLQGEKEMRPAMEEVLESLKEIQNFKETLPENANGTLEEFNKTRNNPSGVAAFSPDSDDRVLLKNVKFPTSPVSVTGLWVSSSSTTTANSSS